MKTTIFIFLALMLFGCVGASAPEKIIYKHSEFEIIGIEPSQTQRGFIWKDNQIGYKVLWKLEDKLYSSLWDKNYTIYKSYKPFSYLKFENADMFIKTQTIKNINEYERVALYLTSVDTDKIK